MATLHTSEKTHRGMLPQSPALEPVPADNPGVGTKRGTGPVPIPGTGVHHGRGETGDVCACAPRRHPSKTDEPVETESGAVTGPVAVPLSVASRVFVLGVDGAALDPCHPARARRLLACGRARVAHHTPFVIRLIDRSAEQSVTHPLAVKIDPGSRHTGMVVARVDPEGRTHGLFAVQVDHRGRQISERLTARAGYRRRRRSANLRYRAPRWRNRHPAACDACGANAIHGRRFCRPCAAAKTPGMGARESRLAPSLAHRVDGTCSMVARLARWAPVAAAVMELVRFDLQALEDPGIAGIGYQQGTLAGYEIREYLLEKYSRTCVYCDRTGVPLQVEHVRPRSRSGSDRVSNLVIACDPCNNAKDSRSVEEFLAADPDRLAKVLAGLRKPLRDATAVNATRWALHRRLQAMFPDRVSVGSGGRTKYNRTRAGLPKTHTLDALCVGRTHAVNSYPAQLVIAVAVGRGVYSRTVPDAYGFPRLQRPRTKLAHGYATGDLVRAAIPTGKYTGTHTGRVMVRTSGAFDVRTLTGRVGANRRHCSLLQRADGWRWSRQEEGHSNDS